MYHRHYHRDTLSLSLLSCTYSKLVEKLVAGRREREREGKRIETFGNLIVTKREQESNGVACLVDAQRRRQVRLMLSVIR